MDDSAERSRMMNGISLKGRIAVDGPLEAMGRGEVKKWLEKAGGTYSESISLQTILLIVGQRPGWKLERALELDIPILCEADFLELAGWPRTGQLPGMEAFADPTKKLKKKKQSAA